jgi:hypothetical protein
LTGSEHYFYSDKNPLMTGSTHGTTEFNQNTKTYVAYVAIMGAIVAIYAVYLGVRDPHVGHDHLCDDEKAADDAEMVMSTGYEKQLHRGLALMSTFAIGFTEVAVLTSLFSTWDLGLTYGGPVEIFWGYVITSFASICVAISMAEICSAYPAAGCVYNWAAQLSPAKHAPLASYACGWLNFCGNMAGDA